MDKKIKIIKGQFLVAEPLLGDSSFERSVILICSYSHDGAVGFVLNKPLNHSLSDLLLYFPSDQYPVYSGGPVEPNHIYYIHTCPEKLPGSLHISGDFYWGGDIEMVIELVKSQQITPKEIRFYLGYSGWGVQQLEDELEEKSWIIFEPNSVNPFADDEYLWKSCIQKLDNNYKIWANSPSDPILN